MILEFGNFADGRKYVNLSGLKSLSLSLFLEREKKLASLIHFMARNKQKKVKIPSWEKQFKNYEISSNIPSIFC
jgi:hypothetical protein